VFSESHFASRQARDQLARLRTGMIVSKSLARKYGWKPGDKVGLHIYISLNKPPQPIAFDIVAVGDDVDVRPGGYAFVNLSYFDEIRPAKEKGGVNAFVIVADAAANADKVAQTIDDTFANSANATITSTEQAEAQAQTNRVFNVAFLARMVVGASFLTLLFLTANTMMQSVRERTSEFAVWKTLGFTDNVLLAIVFAECALICAVGAAVGLTIAEFLMPLTPPSIGVGAIPPVVIGEGILAALFVAVISGLPPGLRANRISVVDALAGR
jgi:putative ABC transport system permease protein